MDLRYELFGGLRVLSDGQEIPVASKTQRKVLAVLLVHAGSTLSADRLIDAVWGEDPPASRQRALHFHLSKLRDAIEPDRTSGASSVVETTAGGYRSVATRTEIDVFRWLAEIEHATDLLDTAPDDALTLTEAVLDAYRPPIPEFEYDDFAQPTIRLVERRLTHVRHIHIDALTAAGRHDEATTALEALHDTDPLNEAVVARLVLALYRSGRQADALRMFDQTRALLVDQLGIDPGPELEEAHLRVLQQDPGLLIASPAAAPRRPHHNLPADPLPLVDREDTFRDLDAALDASRLVTLTGMAGVGKSRAARAWARDRRDRFPAGVVHVDVASLPHSAHLHEEMAAALSAVTGRAEDPANALAAAADLELLVLLDGVDDRHDVADVVRSLLAGDACRVLATAAGAPDFGGSTISVSGLDEQSSHDLFVANRRASGLDGDGDDWARTVAVTGGNPAAIAFAALASRFGGVDEAPSLVAAEFESLIARSIARLDDDQRTALSSLSLFHGPVVLSEADEVMADADTVGVLGALLDRGLIGSSERGIEVSDHIRRVAARDAGDDATGRHAATVARRTAERLIESSPDTEDALRHFADHDPGSGVAMLAAVGPLLWQTGRNELAAAWNRLGLERVDATLAAERALFYAIHSALAIGDSEAAGRYLVSHRSIGERLGEPATLYTALAGASLAWFEGRSGEAADAYAAAATIADRLRHPDAATAWFGRGMVGAATGNLGAAEEAADVLLTLEISSGLRWAGNLAAELLGTVALHRNNADLATEHLVRARESSRPVDRIAAGRQLVVARLVADDVDGANAEWATLEAELELTGRPAGPGVLWTGALLSLRSSYGDEAAHRLARAARATIAKPAATWVGAALRVVAADRNESRRLAARDMAARHAAATGLTAPILGLGAGDAATPAGQFDLADALAFLAPTASATA